MMSCENDFDITPPTENMLKFAEACRTLGIFYDSAVDSQGNCCSEVLALRFSTCRNAYLTLNAVFKDLRDILGRKDADDPLLKRALHCCQRLDWTGLDKILQKMGMLHGQVKTKLEVWDDRIKLDKIKDETLERMNRIERDRVRLILYSVRSESKRRGQSWERKFWEISITEPQELSASFSIVRECSAKIGAISSTLNALSAWGTLKTQHDEDKKRLKNAAPHLFIDEVKMAGAKELAAVEEQLKHCWRSFEDSVLKYKQELDMELIVEGDTRIVRGYGLNAHSTERHYSLGNVTVGLPYFLEHFSVMEHKICEKISNNFRLNIPKCNMPAPFIIDLTPQTSQLGDDSDIDNIMASLKPHSQNCSNPVIKIAFLDITLPEGLLDCKAFNYNNTNTSREIAELIKEAIIQAKTAGADAIVLPEYFIPRDPYLQTVIDCASTQNLALIGGLVGSYDASGDFHNEAVIMLPQASWHEELQAKHRYSNEEPNRLTSNKEHIIFKNTAIGTFAVVICSDYLEADIINCIRKAEKDIDLLIVCCTNARPDIFLQIASGDAYRLYTNIIIVNQYPNILPEHCPPYNGSACFTPTSKKKATGSGGNETNGKCSNFINDIDPEPIPGSNLKFQSQDVPLYMFSVDIDLLRNKKKEKPTSPGMHVPHARRIS